MSHHVSLCLLVIAVRPAEAAQMAKPVELPFGAYSCGPKEPYIGGIYGCHLMNMTEQLLLGNDAGFRYHVLATCYHCSEYSIHIMFSVMFSF